MVKELRQSPEAIKAVQHMSQTEPQQIHSQPLHCGLIGNGTNCRQHKAIEYFSTSFDRFASTPSKWSNSIMTYSIADHNGCNLNPKEETEWPVFDRNQEYCGQIWLTASWAVPAGIHEEFGLRNDTDLYLTSVGHWAPTLEQAEHYLANTAAPTEFRLKGASLGLFFPVQWAEDNGIPNTYSDYRVFRCSAGYWDAEKIEPTLARVGVAEPF